MNLHKRVFNIPVFVALICACSLLRAQQPAAGGDSYFRDLGRIIGEIRTVQWTVDVCADEFPETTLGNQEAANRWTRKYSPFISEMTTKFEAFPAYWAGLDPRSAAAAPETWRRLNEALDSGRNVLKDQFTVQLGPEKFHYVCLHFPLALESERWNLEQHHREKVAAIRRGP